MCLLSVSVCKLYNIMFCNACYISNCYIYYSVLNECNRMLKYNIIHPRVRVLWGCSAPPAILPQSSQWCVKMAVFQLYRQPGKQRRAGWVGTTVMLFWVKNSPMRKQMWDGALSSCNNQFFCRQSSGRSLRTFPRSHSSTWNWLFDLPGWVLCQQFPWCQRKWWACSWLFSSPVSPYSVSVSTDFPCTVHAFFPERLSNHCQDLCLTFGEICITFYAVPLSDRLRNRIRPDTRLQIKGSKNQHVHSAAWSFVHWLPKLFSAYLNCLLNRRVEREFI
jgi:hypothetical protein